MPNEYRIRELNGKFTIEIKVIIKTVKRKLFSKTIHITEEWQLAGDDGEQIIVTPFGRLNPPAKQYNTLVGAKDQVRRWLDGPTYHAAP